MRFLWLVGLCAVGCSTSGGAPPMDAGVSDAATANPDLIAADPNACTDAPAERPDGGSCLLSVSGMLIDEKGAPLPDVPLSVCGSACYYGRSGAGGSFTVPIRAHLILPYYALDIDGRPDRANYYVVLPAPTDGRVTFGAPLVDPLLPASGPELKTDSSAQTVTQGDVTIEVAQGTEVMLDVEDAAMLPLGAQLRTITANATDAKKLPFIDAANPPDLLFGFAPFEAEFSVKTPLSFANVAALPKGAAVDVLAQRGLIGKVLPPPGGFDRVAGAHVSADGTRITMDPGEGILHLTWIALVKK